MTKKEFVDLEQNKANRKNIVGCAIVCYVAAAITLISGIITGTVLSGIIEVVALVVLGLIIHFKYSFPAAVILLIYGIANCAAWVAVEGKLGGVLIPIAGIYAVLETRKINKAWKDYQIAEANGAVSEPEQNQYQ